MQEYSPAHGAEPLPVEFRVTQGVKGPGEEAFRGVPLVKGTIAPGGARIVDENVKDYVIIHSSQFHGRRNLVVVVLDREDKAVVPEGIYAVREREGWATLNRLFYGEGSLMLIPENREEQPQVLRLMKGETAEQFIVGRVNGISQQLKD